MRTPADLKTRNNQPNFWCRYCATFVRDTPLEKKNHEQSGKHQNNIAKSIRDLTKGKEREERDKQRARDEVARLNGLVGGKGSPSPAVGGKPTISGLRDVGKQTAAPAPAMSAEARRKMHAEQLAALGIELPEELKKEVTGIGSWETVAERVVEEEEQPRGLADIKADEDSKEYVQVEGASRGVRKRKVEDGEDEEASQRRRTWGSSRRTYPGSGGGDEGAKDLDALLSGVVKKPKEVKKEDEDEVPRIKREGSAGDVVTAPNPAPGAEPVADADIKQETDAAGAVPAVVFKKRKVKK